MDSASDNSVCVCVCLFLDNADNSIDLPAQGAQFKVALELVYCGRLLVAGPLVVVSNCLGDVGGISGVWWLMLVVVRHNSNDALVIPGAGRLRLIFGAPLAQALDIVHVI